MSARLKYPVPIRGITKNNAIPVKMIQIVDHRLMPPSGTAMCPASRANFRMHRYMSKLMSVDTRATMNRNSVATKEMSIVSEAAAKSCRKERTIK